MQGVPKGAEVNMLIGILKILTIISPVFLGIGLGAYIDSLNKKDKKRVAKATKINKK